MSEDIDELKGVAEFMSGPPASRTITNIPIAKLARYWWVELLLGVFWLVIAAVVLKFNHASVSTVGVLIGIMFLIFAAEEFALAVLDQRRHQVAMGILWGSAGGGGSRLADPSPRNVRGLR